MCASIFSLFLVSRSGDDFRDKILHVRHEIVSFYQKGQNIISSLSKIWVFTDMGNSEGCLPENEQNEIEFSMKSEPNYGNTMFYLFLIYMSSRRGRPIFSAVLKVKKIYMPHF